MAKLPEFKNLDDEVQFWETHSTVDYSEDLEQVEFEVNLRQNLLHPKLTILSERPQRCPRCQSELDDLAIQYMTWNDTHLVFIRDVAALRCRANRHEFITEETLDAIEKLLTLDQSHQVQAVERVQVPVFSLAR